MTSFEPEIYFRSKTPGDSFRAGRRKFETPVNPEPSAIQNVVVTPGDGQVTITWTPPATGVVSGYRVGRTASPGGTAWESTKPAGTTSQTFLSLTNGHPYEMYIEPYNDFGHTRTTRDATPTAGVSTGAWESNGIAFSWQRPYTATSIWKRRIDPAAPRVPAGTAGFRSVDGWSGAAPLENVHFFSLVHESPLQTVARYNKASVFGDKCANRGTFDKNVQLPVGWNNRTHLADPGKNNQINVLQTDGDALVLYQASMACSSTEFVAGNPVYNTSTISSDGLRGARGAARVANGGCVRQSDLDEPNILHALELVADQKYLYGTLHGGPSEPGYRWPAWAPDANYDNPSSTGYYTGSVPEMKMGSLVSIPANYDYAANGITNAFVRKVGDCLKAYGAYIVDITAWKSNSAWALSVDSAVAGQVSTGLGWSASETKSQWFKLIEALQVVDVATHPENPN